MAVLKLLYIENQSDIDVRSGGILHTFDNLAQGLLVLHFAAFGGCVDCIHLLMHHVVGTDVNCTDYWGRTPMWFAASAGHVTAIRALRQLGSTFGDDGGGHVLQEYPLWVAAHNGHTAAVQCLVELGSAMDVIAPHYSPISSASRRGHVATVRKLIELGADVNIRSCDSVYHETPLHLASYKGSLETVDVLVSNGAQLNVENSLGETPLCSHAYEGHLVTSRRLVDSGAWCWYSRDHEPSVLSYVERGLIRRMIHPLSKKHSQVMNAFAHTLARAGCKHVS